MNIRTKIKLITLLSIALIIILFLLVGCDATNRAYVQDTPPINVAISGTPTITASIPTPLPVTITPSPLPVNINNVTTVEDARLGVMAKDYFVGVAEGDIANHTAWDVIGYNSAVGTTSEDIWIGSSVYVFPTVAQQMAIVSSSTSDTSAGTGIQKVTINYLDASYVQHSEDVTLNGTTPVNTVSTTIFRVNNLFAKTVGSTYAAVGQIKLTNTAGTVTYRYIDALYTRSRGTIYTVPTGKTLYITDWNNGVSGLNASNFARLTIRVTYNDLTSTILTPGLFFFPLAGTASPNATSYLHFTVPIKVPATCDLKVSAYSDAGSSAIESVMRGWIESN